MQEYLAATEIIDWQHPGVRARADALADGVNDPEAIARRCFEWVRDHIQHSGDLMLSPVSCSASDTLQLGSGFCYAKSHLLAALLRANEIPAGLCYQRLSQNGSGAPFCLHGLNAVFLSRFGWYRIDPRGNRAGVDAQFAPPIERLAFAIRQPGEADLPEIWSEPLPVVVEALHAHRTTDELLAHLPDVLLWPAGAAADHVMPPGD